MLLYNDLTSAFYILVICLVTFQLAKWIKFYVEFKEKMKHIRKLPGEDLHPILGHLSDMPGPHEAGIVYMMEKVSKIKEGLGKLCFGPFHPGVGVFLPHTVKAILKTSEPKPKGFLTYRFLLSWLGDGLLIAGGEKWAVNRRLLTPAFHFDILKPYIAVNNQCVNDFINKVSHISEDGKSVDIFSHVSLLTMDIILQCAFSYDIDCQKVGEKHPYVKAVVELARATVVRTLKPWMYPDFIFYNLTSVGRRYARNCHYVHQVSDDIIQQRKKSLKGNEDSIFQDKKFIDFLDILLMAKDSNGQGLSDLDIRNEVDTFLFEGHDTTASGISWTLYSLAEHPEIQTKCQKEVDDLLHRRDTDDIQWNDLSNLPYLSMCIKESLRLHSPVPIIQRMTTKELDIDGHYIPANVMVDINLYALHHSPDVWDEPYEFRPERFSPENVDKMDPFAFVPFSAGPRNCIGQNFAMHEMKVVIARILRREVTLIPEENEDMWHAYNLVQVGDSLRSTTIRKVQTESATGSTSSNKVRTTLTIKVETIDFDTQACVLRVKGRNIQENQYVKMGAYHTLDLELNRKFTLAKHEWDSVALERIDQACDPTQSADLAAVVMQEGIAHVCLVTSSMTLVRAKIDTNIPRKRKGMCAQHDKGMCRFYDQIIQAILRHVNFDIVKCVLVASPGFVKDQFYEYMFNQAQKMDYKLLLENKSQFLLIHSSSGFKHALKEVLQDPVVNSKLADTKALSEVKSLEDFYGMLQHDPNRAFYGIRHVEAANEAQAIETLLISDELFRSIDLDKRKRYVKLVDSVRENAGDVRIFSSLHVSGEQLGQLSGVAAILRFPIPDPEDDDEYSSSDEE